MDLTFLASLAGAGASLAVVIELLKKTPLPTEKPKRIVMILAIILVIVIFSIDHNFTIENVGSMATQIGIIFAAAIAFYEAIIKPIYVLICRFIAYLKKK